MGKTLPSRPIATALRQQLQPLDKLRGLGNPVLAVTASCLLVIAITSAALPRALSIDHNEGWQRGKTVANGVISYLLMLAGSLLLDATVQPRRIGGWRWQGRCLHLLVMTTVFGLFLAGSGNAPVAAILTVAMMALFTITSNAKHKMLGEPLVFSDLALIAALVRHPRFYFTAVSLGQRWTLAISAPILLVALAALFVPRLAPHLAGLGLFTATAAALLLLLKSRTIKALARVPDVEADLARLGIMPTLLLYWLRWRRTPDPPVCPVLDVKRKGGLSAKAAPPALIVIVQCESFADPVELTGEHRDTLSGLTNGRALAWQWGDLEVSGFGAYTMRTEYGVLFGRSEAALGFRRYDPFLTAQGETSYALSTRLSHAGYHCLFVHPHDMRFYGRDRLMPAIGFDHLIGEESFPPIPDGARYIGDEVVGAALGDYIDKADGPTLIYAVTMENHGPWDRDQFTGSPGGLDAYLRHLRSSDAMLSELVKRMSGAGRPGLLVFFGDHRPSIPGVTEPGGARHTPYVMLRFAGDGQVLTGTNVRADLSPDQLHHAILRCAQGDDEPGEAPSNDTGTFNPDGV